MFWVKVNSYITGKHPGHIAKFCLCRDCHIKAIVPYQQSIEPTNSTAEHKDRKMRYRTAFTTDQLKYLESHFISEPYVSNDLRKKLATKLNVSERVVKVWFQNRRMKQKKEKEQAEIERIEAHSKKLMTSTSNDQKPISLPSLTNYIQNIRISNSIPAKSHSDDVKTAKEESKIESLKRSNIIPSDSKPATEYEIQKLNLDLTLPQDLSLPKILSAPKIISPSKNNYISMLPIVSTDYQSFGVLSGGVLWKPVGIVPSSLSGASLASDLSNDHVVQENGAKNMCNSNKCKCNLQHQCRCPPYLITAMPIVNSAAKS